MTEITGIDHIYIVVADLRRSESFYDRALVGVLECRKNTFTLGGDPHIQYFNRHFGFVLRPARAPGSHSPYTPGLHHFCFRVETAADVHNVSTRLREAGIDASEARQYPDYAPDYVATFFTDPDGLRLEVTTYRQERHDRNENWSKP